MSSPAISDPTAFVVKVISQLLSDLVARNDQASARPCFLNSTRERRDDLPSHSVLCVKKNTGRA